jgi:hypothetical protein
MAVLPESRYVTTYDIVDEDKRPYMSRRRSLKLNRDDTDQPHVTVQGEKLWQIAYTYWGRDDLWYAIADYNNISSVFTAHLIGLQKGTTLQIPQLSRVLAALNK